MQCHRCWVQCKHQFFLELEFAAAGFLFFALHVENFMKNITEIVLYWTKIISPKTNCKPKSIYKKRNDKPVKI
ncbi:hypothetical protein RT99_13945 [Flavobacterium sp. MEB061]|nr:hypothetical protein RT99_13945 [Flavobacterium sp. MEB061]